MKFAISAFRPVHAVLLAALLVFLWNSNELASIERESAPALAELQAANPGARQAAGMDYFIREYLSAPFGRAIGMTERQLQLCHHLFTLVPAYQSALTWRNRALLVGLGTLLFLGLKRYASPMRRNLNFSDLRHAAVLLRRRISEMTSPFVARMQERVAQKRAGATPRAVHNIVACPTCRQQLRLPVGKGRIRVTCSACGTQFESVT